MIRFLNFLALSAVIASATWAYSVKYETILVAEKLKKRETELRRERDAIQVLSAEWELLNRPARLMVLAKPEAGMQQLSAKQVANAKDIPAPQPVKGDSLDALLTGSIASMPAPKATPAAGLPKPVAKAGVVRNEVKASSGKAPVNKVATRIPEKKTQGIKTQANKAIGDKADAKVVAVHAAPLALTPKAGAARKAQTPKIKAAAPGKLTPPAPVAASTPKRDEGGINALFKKILN